MTFPPAGMRVLDLSRTMAGPYASGDSSRLKEGRRLGRCNRVWRTP